MLTGALVAVLLLASIQRDLAHAQITPDETINYAEGRTDAVATFTAVDPDGTRVVWSLAGTDRAVFAINNGVLTFLKSPNFESPGDVAGSNQSTAQANDNIYEVTVQATDETMMIGKKEVSVTVTNVEEKGKVSLSARRPQSAILFSADISDPDGETLTNIRWQWSKSSSRSGTYANIANAENAAYTPTDDDVGAFLRATVTYTDPEDSGKTAMESSEFAAQRVRGSNSAPEFAADQDPVMTGDQADAPREVAEDTAAGQPVGSPVTASDDDGDTLTYTLDGTDKDSFDINWGTGQILTKTALNHETKDDYTVTVRATDPAGIPQAQSADVANSDEVTVVITVTDVNEAPAVSGDAEVTFQEVQGIIATALHTYTAADPDDGAPTPTWSVAGVDGAKFTAEGGALMFNAQPDFEAPTDANRDNVYEVTVQASEGKLVGMKRVKVTVLNEEEAGTVTLSKSQPRVGIPVTATLNDPDGSISRLAWQWSTQGGSDIPGATSDTYVPKASDLNNTLVATASYTDGHGSGKSKAGETDNPVAADTRNRAPVFGDQDPFTDGVQNDTATRMVDENTEAIDADDASTATDDDDDNVGSPVTAEDPDPNEDALTYTLSGADAASFRVRDNGQIEVGAGTELDAESSKTTYRVTLAAEDSFGAKASIDVTITVTPVDEVPEVTGNDEIDYAEKGTGSVATYRASDPERTAIRWSLNGTDKNVFAINNGVLTFFKSPDFENPADVVGTSPSTAAAEDNIYEVTIQAIDENFKIGTKEVVVTVTNVEEPGRVSLSARRPESATAFTARIDDPDGQTTNAKWQWAKSRSRNGSYANIANAETATYTPTDDDLGAFLRATVTYTDPEDPGKTAAERSETSVQEVRGANTAPAFAADQDPVNAGNQANASREVAENTSPGQPVGSPVTATDDDGDTLTYTLGGTDAASFDINWGTGQILTKAALNFEDKAAYTVTVRATDPSGDPSATNAVTASSAEVTVNISITDVNEAPAVTGDPEVTFDEVDDAIAIALDIYAATDRDAGAPTAIWSVGGVDGGKFTAEGGELQFKAKPDFELPTDNDGDNVYEISVQASDGRLTGMMAVTVTVQNQEEPGTITLSKTQPRVGIPVKATLTDPDGTITKLSWRWSDGSNDIPGATSDTFVPTSDEVGDTLSVTATYSDGHGPDKTQTVDAANAVAADTRNRAPAFVDQDPLTDGVQNDEATRRVEETTEANGTDDTTTDVDTDNVGEPVTANDPDPNADPLTYTLSGADAASFRVRGNGQIEVAAGTDLNFEAKDTYEVTLTAEDSFGARATIDVTITIIDIDERPVLTNKALVVVGEVRFEYREDRTDPLGTYEVAGPDAARARWGLAGPDARRFELSSSGVLSFRSSPNYEAPADTGSDNSYVVIVRASYRTLSDERTVTIRVINVDEVGAVTLSPSRASLGVEITAEVSDLDVVTAGTVIVAVGKVRGRRNQLGRYRRRHLKHLHTGQCGREQLP